MRYETEVGYYYLAFQSNGHLKRNKMLERMENFTSSLETVDVSSAMSLSRYVLKGQGSVLRCKCEN